MRRIWNTKWEETQLGKDFAKLGFQMFTIDQLLNGYDYEGEDTIKMTLGKSDRKLTERVQNAMINAIKEQSEIIRVESEGSLMLRQAVCSYYNERFNVNYNENEVIIGSQGTSSLYRDIFTLLLFDGGDVYLPKPGYILYEAAAQIVKSMSGKEINIKHYEIDLSENRINIGSLKNTFDSERARIIVVNSPGNPTGNHVTREEWNEIIELVNQSKQCVIINDQVYSNIVFENKKYCSILDKELFDKLEAPIIITDSLSKGFEMYTYRVGFAFVPEEIRKPIIAFQRNFSLTPVTVSQFAAVEALQQPEVVKELKDLYDMRNQYALRKLTGISCIEVVKSEGGFYFVINCNEIIKNKNFENDVELAIDIAKNTFPHVGTTPGSDFGADGYLRISFSSARFEEGIDLLAAYFMKNQ